MPSKNINRKIAEESFDYGNHEIKVTVRLKHTNRYENLDHNVLNDTWGYHYYRFVLVDAHGPDGSREVKHQSAVAVDVERKQTKDHWLFGSIETGTEVPDVPAQVEETVRPVLSELDSIYEITEPETDVEMEIALHRVEHEMSWVEVDDAVDRISNEIDALAEANE
jgi:hypothetical protein